VMPHQALQRRPLASLVAAERRPPLGVPKQRFRMTKKKSRTVIVCAVLYLLLLSVARALIGESSVFVTIAEGFSSETQQRGIEVAYGMFSAPDLGRICSKSERPSRLVAKKVPIALRVGEWFPLDHVVIVAMDETGKQLQPVPIMFEVEEREPPLLNLRSDMIAEARVLPVRAGSFRFLARTICSDPSVAILLEATVIEP